MLSVKVAPRCSCGAYPSLAIRDALQSRRISLCGIRHLSERDTRDGNSTYNSIRIIVSIVSRISGYPPGDESGYAAFFLRVLPTRPAKVPSPRAKLSMPSCMPVEL